MDVIIIGAGPGGIAAGKRLRDAGIQSFVILEQAPGIGGTWWHNIYPGCRCDVPSHLYSFSFAIKRDWTEPYASQPEIQQYLEACAETFDLMRHVRLDHRVVAARWLEARARWEVETADGALFCGDTLISAVGMFNMPAYPPLPGLETFEGPVMHSARWRPEIPLAGRRISVIGSAASAVQLVPPIAEVAGRLDLYQRTPNYVSARQNSFAPGERERLMRDPEAARQERQRIWDWLEAVAPLDNPEIMADMRRACLANLQQVADPALRRLLTPAYPFGAKRGLVSSDWYPTFNRQNVSLITTPIWHVGPHHITTASGDVRETDLIVLATGFETTRFLSSIPVTGRDNLRLDQAWQGGAEAYLGIAVSGFPNLFMIYGPNTNNGSIIAQIESQVDYIVRKIDFMIRNGLKWIEVRQSALAAYNRALQDAISTMAVWQHGISDYYRAPSGLIVTQWPFSMARYREATLREDRDAFIVSHGAGSLRPADVSRTWQRG